MARITAKGSQPLCRATCSKQYADSTFRSYLHMHSVYSKHVLKNGEQPVSRQIFTEVLKENKIDIHSPRKDQCDICVSYKCQAVSQAEYDLHIVKKDEARLANNNVKASASNS